MEYVKKIIRYFVLVYIFFIRNVFSECSLHVCFNCTVICHTATVTQLDQQMSESTCIGQLNNDTVRAVEYRRSSKVCLLSANKCVTYSEILDEMSIAYTYRCSADCSAYLLTARKRMRVTDQPSYYFPSMPDLCVETSIGNNHYVFEVHGTSSCYWFANCEIDYSCSYSPTAESVVTINRTCVTPCQSPAAPSNGEVFYPLNRRLLLGDTATYICDFDLYLSGSSTSECLMDGSWSHETPSCSSGKLAGLIPPSSSSVSTTISTTSTMVQSSSTTIVPATTTSDDSAISTTSLNSNSVHSTTSSSISSTSLNSNSVHSTTSSSILTTPPSSTLTMSSSQTNLTSSVTSPPVPIYLQPCHCGNNYFHGNQTVEDLTAIDPKQTSAAKNKLISKPDPRRSARIIGFTGGAVLVGCALVFISCDLCTFLFKCKVKTKTK